LTEKIVNYLFSFLTNVIKNTFFGDIFFMAKYIYLGSTWFKELVSTVARGRYPF